MFRVQRSLTKTIKYRIFIRLEASEYSTEVQTQPTVTSIYPQVNDVSPHGVFRTQQEKYFEKIKALETVEEKIIALNMPRYWGWPAFILKEGVLPYNPLPFAQFLTRTVISQSNKLPLFRKDESTQTLLTQLKKELEKVVLFENNFRR